MLKVVDVNRSCDECGTNQAQIACRCKHPPTLLCYNCLGPHCQKNPQQIHMQQSITVSDLEELKEETSLDIKQVIKSENTQNIAISRTLLLNRLETFKQNRFRQIDEVMAEIQKRGNLLKEHIDREKSQVSEKFDVFVQEVLTTDHYDYLLQSDTVLQFEKLFQIEFLAESPVQASWDNIFDPRSEIKVTTPYRHKEMQFDVDKVQDYFIFENDNLTATFQKVQDHNFSSVKNRLKSSGQQNISVKFTMNHSNIYFGIWNDMFQLGFPGFTNNGWQWNCSGSGAYHGSQSNDYPKHNLSDLKGKEVEISYESCTKTFKITWQGEVWSHHDQNMPTEAYFVFSMHAVGQQICLIPN